MSGLNLEAIQARADAATPGPWGVGDGTEIGLGIEQDEDGGFYFDAIVAQATTARRWPAVHDLVALPVAVSASPGAAACPACTPSGGSRDR
jgi:hypothetical protein